ncbi:MAG TPA: ROK family protein [Polyangiaceae bacterium]|nr:ROK family protein [Polyangiaceae bacterium]
MPESLLSQVPKVPPPLHPEFRPAALGNRAFRAAVASRGGSPLALALQRDGGTVSRFETRVFPDDHPDAFENLRYVERLLKFLLWQKGAFEVKVAGSPRVAAHLTELYAARGARAFDARFFAKIYEQAAFRVEAVPFADLPPEHEAGRAIGGHLNGCRIGFDAGGSDRKVAAVIDGKPVFSCEVVWDPKLHSDPQYHFDGIDDSIRRAAAHLPRIDAIGVSSAGIYLNNRTMVASLFRRVAEPDFEAKIKHLYPDIARKWGGVPLEVANDGDVTALAGALELEDHSVLGLALGTSVAAGYVNGRGLVTGWLNELAFAPVDYGTHAVVDHDWSGDCGTGVNYFSQDAVIRLAGRAELELPAGSPGAKLEFVQSRLGAGDARAREVFETIGVYLGYGLLHYLDFYALKHVLLLGRVMSGEAGNLVLEQAREVLRLEAPELSRSLFLHLPDEATRRVGQAIAAASLPRLNAR